MPTPQDIPGHIWTQGTPLVLNGTTAALQTAIPPAPIVYALARFSASTSVQQPSQWWATIASLSSETGHYADFWTDNCAMSLQFRRGGWTPGDPVDEAEIIVTGSGGNEIYHYEQAVDGEYIVEFRWQGAQVGVTGASGVESVASASRGPVTSHNVSIGAGGNDSTPMIGTLSALTLFSAMPSPAQRADLLEWVRGEATEPPNEAIGAAVEGGQDIAATAIAVRVTTAAAAQEAGADTAAALAAVSVTVSATPREPRKDAAAASAAVGIAGAGAAAEAGADSAAATITVVWSGIAATGAAAEAGSDSAAAAATVANAAAAAVAEVGPDTASASVDALTLGIVVAASVTETGADSASASAGVSLASAVAATEAGPDMAAGAAALAVHVGGAAAETGPDTAAAVAGADWTGVLVSGAAVETGSDAASGMILVPLRMVIAALEAGQDRAAGATDVAIGAIIAAIETGQDAAAGRASVLLEALRYAYPGEVRAGRIMGGGARTGTIIRG